MRHLRASAVVACLAVLLAWGCGGPGTEPSPPPGNGGNPPPPVNTAPQVKSIALSETRAEVGVPMTVTATVEDLETPVASLTYAWTADTGSFTGTGPIVTWVAGQDATTPADVVLTLTVTEKYGTGSTAGEHKVTGTTTVHLNNSPKELTELSLRFLGNFANSKVSPETCVAEFSDSCRGKKDEFDDIDDNRHDFEIIGSTLRHTSLSIAPSRTTATVHTFCSFTSRVIAAAPREENCSGGRCPVGSIGSVQGDCWTTNVYEKGRWWICESHFSSPSTLSAIGRAFFGLRGPG
jgi:hypothetical protein